MAVMESPKTAVAKNPDLEFRVDKGTGKVDLPDGARKGPDYEARVNGVYHLKQIKEDLPGSGSPSHLQLQAEARDEVKRQLGNEKEALNAALDRLTSKEKTRYLALCSQSYEEARKGNTRISMFVLPTSEFITRLQRDAYGCHAGNVRCNFDNISNKSAHADLELINSIQGRLRDYGVALPQVKPLPERDRSAEQVRKTPSFSADNYWRQQIGDMGKGK